MLHSQLITQKKELANKNTKFECKILNVKKPKSSKIDDEFAKLMGAKDIKEIGRASCRERV